MLDLDIKVNLKLKDLEIRSNNYEDILNLYKGNEEYAKLSNNYPVTIENVKKDVEDIPPITDAKHKHFFSIYNRKNNLVAVLDIIDGYSYKNKDNKEAIWIGLLEIDIDNHKSGLGKAIIDNLVNCSMKNNKKLIQLGVIKNNSKALAFWKRVGFEVFKEVNNGEHDLFLMEKHL